MAGVRRPARHPEKDADVRRHVGMKLRAARQAAGFSLSDVEFGVGVKMSVNGSYERAERTIDVETFVTLCRMYGVEPLECLPGYDEALPAPLLPRLSGKRVARAAAAFQAANPDLAGAWT